MTAAALPSLLELRGLKAAVGPSVSLSLDAGECLAVRGPSGAGKSLLLRAIADLDRHTGEVLLDGHAQASLPAPRWRRQVMYLAAEPGWWAHVVADHMSDPEAARRLLPALDLDADCLGWEVARLSSGERQRLGLVRALCHGPRVLLLDEPTSSLDAARTAAVEALLDARRGEGTALLWITHDDDQSRRVARRSLVIDGEARIEALP